MQSRQDGEETANKTDRRSSSCTVRSSSDGPTNVPEPKVLRHKGKSRSICLDVDGPDSKDNTTTRIDIMTIYQKENVCDY